MQETTFAAKRMATLENFLKNRSHCFNFRAIGYLFGRDVAYLISLNLNNRKINRGGGGDLRVILQRSMRSFSLVSGLHKSHGLLHGRLSAADRCFSHCTELITENHTHYIKLTCKKLL